MFYRRAVRPSASARPTTFAALPTASPLLYAYIALSNASSSAAALRAEDDEPHWSRSSMVNGQRRRLTSPSSSSRCAEPARPTTATTSARSKSRQDSSDIHSSRHDDDDDDFVNRFRVFVRGAVLSSAHEGEEKAEHAKNDWVQALRWRLASFAAASPALSSSSSPSSSRLVVRRPNSWSSQNGPKIATEVAGPAATHARRWPPSTGAGRRIHHGYDDATAAADRVAAAGAAWDVLVRVLAERGRLREAVGCCVEAPVVGLRLRQDTAIDVLDRLSRRAAVVVRSPNSGVAAAAQQQQQKQNNGDNRRDRCGGIHSSDGNATTAAMAVLLTPRAALASVMTMVAVHGALGKRYRAAKVAAVGARLLMAGGPWPTRRELESGATVCEGEPIPAAASPGTAAPPDDRHRDDDDSCGGDGNDDGWLRRDTVVAIVAESDRPFECLERVTRLAWGESWGGAAAPDGWRLPQSTSAAAPPSPRTRRDRPQPDHQRAGASSTPPPPSNNSRRVDGPPRLDPLWWFELLCWLQRDGIRRYYQALLLTSSEGGGAWRSESALPTREGDSDGDGGGGGRRGQSRRDAGCDDGVMPPQRMPQAQRVATERWRTIETTGLRHVLDRCSSALTLCELAADEHHDGGMMAMEDEARSTWVHNDRGAVPSSTASSIDRPCSTVCPAGCQGGWATSGDDVVGSGRAAVAAGDGSNTGGEPSTPLFLRRVRLRHQEVWSSFARLEHWWHLQPPDHALRDGGSQDDGAGGDGAPLTSSSSLLEPTAEDLMPPASTDKGTRNGAVAWATGTSPTVAAAKHDVGGTHPHRGGNEADGHHHRHPQQHAVAAAAALVARRGRAVQPHLAELTALLNRLLAFAARVEERHVATCPCRWVASPVVVDNRGPMSASPSNLAAAAASDRRSNHNPLTAGAAADGALLVAAWHRALSVAAAVEAGVAASCPVRVFGRQTLPRSVMNLDSWERVAAFAVWPGIDGDTTTTTTSPAQRCYYHGDASVATRRRSNVDPCGNEPTATEAAAMATSSASAAAAVMTVLPPSGRWTLALGALRQVDLFWRRRRRSEKEGPTFVGDGGEEEGDHHYHHHHHDDNAATPEEAATTRNMTRTTAATALALSTAPTRAHVACASAAILSCLAQAAAELSDDGLKGSERQHQQIQRSRLPLLLGQPPPSPRSTDAEEEGWSGGVDRDDPHATIAVGGGGRADAQPSGVPPAVGGHDRAALMSLQRAAALTERYFTGLADEVAAAAPLSDGPTASLPSPSRLDPAQAWLRDMPHTVLPAWGLAVQQCHRFYPYHHTHSNHHHRHDRRAHRLEGSSVETRRRTASASSLTPSTSVVGGDNPLSGAAGGDNNVGGEGRDYGVASSSSSSSSSSSAAAALLLMVPPPLVFAPIVVDAVPSEPAAAGVRHDGSGEKGVPRKGEAAAASRPPPSTGCGGTGDNIVNEEEEEEEAAATSSCCGHACCTVAVDTLTRAALAYQRCVSVRRSHMTVLNLDGQGSKRLPQAETSTAPIQPHHPPHYDGSQLYAALGDDPTFLSASAVVRALTLPPCRRWDAALSFQRRRRSLSSCAPGGGAVDGQSRGGGSPVPPLRAAPVSLSALKAVVTAMEAALATPRPPRYAAPQLPPSPSGVIAAALTAWRSLHETTLASSVWPSLLRRHGPSHLQLGDGGEPRRQLERMLRVAIAGGSAVYEAHASAARTARCSEQQQPSDREGTKVMNADDVFGCVVPPDVVAALPRAVRVQLFDTAVRQLILVEACQFGRLSRVPFWKRPVFRQQWARRRAHLQRHASAVPPSKNEGEIIGVEAPNNNNNIAGGATTIATMPMPSRLSGRWRSAVGGVHHHDAAVPTVGPFGPYIDETWAVEAVCAIARGLGLCGAVAASPEGDLNNCNRRRNKDDDDGGRGGTPPQPSSVSSELIMGPLISAALVEAMREGAVRPALLRRLIEWDFMT